MKKLLLAIILLFVLSACEKPAIEYDIVMNNGKDIIYQSEAWVDNGAYITIEEVNHKMIRVNEIDSTNFEEQTILYHYEYEGITYETKRIVKVIENPNFEITLAPGLDTIKQNKTHIDAGLVFNGEDESHFTIIVTNNVNTLIADSYTITYTIYDQYGAILTLTRIVNVIS